MARDFRGVLRFAFLQTETPEQIANPCGSVLLNIGASKASAGPARVAGWRPATQTK